MTTPSRRDRLRPAELLGLSAGFGVFTGLVVLMTTRDLDLGLIFLCVAFIVGLVVLAMLSLATAPDAEEQSELDESDRPKGH